MLAVVVAEGAHVSAASAAVGSLALTKGAGSAPCDGVVSLQEGMSSASDGTHLVDVLAWVHWPVLHFEGVRWWCQRCGTPAGATDRLGTRLHA